MATRLMFRSFNHKKKTNKQTNKQPNKNKNKNKNKKSKVSSIKACTHSQCGLDECETKQLLADLLTLKWSRVVLVDSNISFHAYTWILHAYHPASSDVFEKQTPRRVILVHQNGENVKSKWLLFSRNDMTLKLMFRLYFVNWTIFFFRFACAKINILEWSWYIPSLANAFSEF